MTSKTTKPKACKAWAIVGTNGKILSIALDRANAWLLLAEGRVAVLALLESAGYKAIPVTIHPND